MCVISDIAFSLFATGHNQCNLLFFLLGVVPLYVCMYVRTKSCVVPSRRLQMVLFFSRKKTDQYSGKAIDSTSVELGGW